MKRPASSHSIATRDLISAIVSISVVSVSILSVGIASVDLAGAAPHKRHTTTAAVARDTDTTATATIPASQAKTSQGKAAQGKTTTSGKMTPGKTTPGKTAASPQLQQTPTALSDDALPAPFHLPQAPRTRMRDCGLKWQAMKMSGEVGEDIWRDFATRCLAAAAGPFEKRSER